MGTNMYYVRRFVILVALASTLSILFVKLSNAPLLHFKTVETVCQTESGWFNPYDKTMTKLLKNAYTRECFQDNPLMYMDAKGTMRLDPSVVAQHKINKTALRCSYSPLERFNGDDAIIAGQLTPFTPPFFIKHPLFRVTCRDSKHDIVYDLAHNNLFVNSTRPTKFADELDVEDEDHLSVLVFGLDSISRSHAVRSMPESIRFLQNQLNSYDFLVHNRIGENTFPNMMAWHTGRSADEFIHIKRKRPYDNISLIWDRTVTKRIVTMFAEDEPKIAAFNYLNTGFNEAPTDFYFRPFTLAIDTFTPVLSPSARTRKIKCYENKRYLDVQLEYIKRFMSMYSGRRKFTFFWNTETGHSTFEGLTTADKTILKFLKWFKGNKATNNTVVILLSDHGYRMGGPSSTPLGRKEANNPWLMVHVPKHITQKYPLLHQTLKDNTKRIVSAFDIHQTLLGLLNNKAFERTSHIRPLQKSLVKRNLFSPIPVDRTCQDAGVPMTYCMCTKKTVFLSNHSIIAQILAERIVFNINTRLEAANMSDVCCVLSVFNISEISVLYDNRNTYNVVSEQQGKGNANNRTGRYTVVFHTSPGFAMFSGRVRLLQRRHEMPSEMTPIGDPLRLDIYGNTSACVENAPLRKYCYCKQQDGT